MPRAATLSRERPAVRSAVINIRVRSDDRAVIDQAAASLGKSRSDFMLEAARRAAEEALLDRTLLRVDRPTYNRFLAMLDAPPLANPKLRELMRLKAPWG
jgi:uncharacterized protein (DUF1778 family)